MEGIGRYNDLLIAMALFSIPLQIAASLYKHPRLRSMDNRIEILALLFTLSVFACGLEYFFRFGGMSMTHNASVLVNVLTMASSVATAIYMIPLVPNLMKSLDDQFTELERQSNDVAAFTEFLCHEICTPLFAITSAASFCEDDVMNVPESVGIIKQSTKLILRLTSDVLELSRIQKGSFRFEERPFNLAEMLQHIASTTRRRVEEKGRNVVFRGVMVENVPSVIYGDSARISQILNNLMGNATKYTDEGSIELSVTVLDHAEALRSGLVTSRPSDANVITRQRCRESDESTESDQLNNSFESGNAWFVGPAQAVVLKMEIKDTGCGIASERIDLISEPYTEAKLSEYRQHGGTGLGLSITTRLIEGMHGSLHVKSVEGKGSVFTVYLPVLTGQVDCPELFEPQQSAQDLELGVPLSRCPLLPPPAWVSTPSPFPIVTETIADATPLSRAVSMSIMPARPDGIVLVVDDIEMNCKIIGRMLKHFKLDYEVAHNGKEAIDAIQRSRNMNPDNIDAPFYSLIFMDWQMPVMDGLEATEKLRQLHKLDIPIVALTANAAPQHRDDALAAGANEFATKPILREELFETCRRYLCDDCKKRAHQD